MDNNTVVIPFSAVSKQGRDEIYALIDKIISNKEEDAPKPMEEE